MAFAIASHYPFKLYFCSHQPVFKGFYLFVRDDQSVLNIVISKGWFYIRLQCSSNVCFKFLTNEWYVATKDNIRSLPFCFCVSADCREAKLSLTEKFLWHADMPWTLSSWICESMKGETTTKMAALDIRSLDRLNICTDFRHDLKDQGFAASSRQHRKHIFPFDEVNHGFLLNRFT